MIYNGMLSVQAGLFCSVCVSFCLLVCEIMLCGLRSESFYHLLEVLLGLCCSLQLANMAHSPINLQGRGVLFCGKIEPENA